MKDSLKNYLFDDETYGNKKVRTNDFYEAKGTYTHYYCTKNNRALIFIAYLFSDMITHLVSVDVKIKTSLKRTVFEAAFGRIFSIYHIKIKVIVLAWNYT